MRHNDPLCSCLASRWDLQERNSNVNRVLAMFLATLLHVMFSIMCLCVMSRLAFRVASMRSPILGTSDGFS